MIASANWLTLLICGVMSRARCSANGLMEGHLLVTK